ncbi:aminoglycoside phosphotransferase family protein [Candidatus Bathyarchaeota archaeon]|nr:MAG: aminoglycoside phosphotransferase family protein [Candidatus Bathyarchaeota archaeon]
MEEEQEIIRFSKEHLEDYLSSVYKAKIRLIKVQELGVEKTETQLKGFGYGKPYLIEFRLKDEVKRVVLETVKPSSFGHEHFSDRAKILLWQYSTFNKLPKHVKSIDVGAFTENGKLKSLGDCKEFFILTEAIEGRLYHADLDEIIRNRKLSKLDLERCKTLAKYLVDIHSLKKDEPTLYIRRIRELIGHGECIMGIIDNYPAGLKYADEKLLCSIEKKCVEWRWKLKKKTHRLSQVHGDFHPWNVMFRQGTDFTVLDRSRGEWGEPADDVTSMTINYIFYSLQAYGRLKGQFRTLFELFWKTYLNDSQDEEILNVVQPFYAWRALVVASPIWYPNLKAEVRMKLFNFIKNVLSTEKFDIDDVNSYLED